MSGRDLLLRGAREKRASDRSIARPFKRSATPTGKPP
jgi:hypothetical protein